METHKRLAPHPYVTEKIKRDIWTVEQEIPVPSQAPQPRVPVPGREVPMTSGCENQQRLWLRETESCRNSRHSSRVHTQTYLDSLPLSSSIGEQLHKHQGQMGRNWIVWNQNKNRRGSFLSDKSLTKAIVSFLILPPIQQASMLHIWVSITVYPNLVIPWDLAPSNLWVHQAISSSFFIQMVCLGSCYRLS